MSDDFDKDLARLEQIRRSHASARPKAENPAWVHTHADLGFALSFIDNLWKEYSRTLAETDRARSPLDTETAKRVAQLRETAAWVREEFGGQLTTEQRAELMAEADNIEWAAREIERG